MDLAVIDFKFLKVVISENSVIYPLGSYEIILCTIIHLSLGGMNYG
jgi:hypothetical protein